MPNKNSAAPAGYFITMDMDDLSSGTKATDPQQTMAAPSSSVNSAGRQFTLAFVNLNEETGPRQDMGTRHKVRAHVMRDFQMKKHRKTKSGSATRSLLPNTRTDGQGTDVENEENSIVTESMGTEEFMTGSQSGVEDFSTSMVMRPPQSPMIGYLAAGDPFDVMPIYGGPVLQSLMHYYNHVLLETLIPVNPKDKWFNHAISDPALFHGTMVHAASHLSLVSSSHDQSPVNGLKRKTINIINERLGDPVLSTSDVTIGAVTLLVLFENQEGNTELSNIHMDGLEKMVNLRGGVEALGLSGVLRRKVLWADLCNAYLSRREPRFAFIPESEERLPVCDRIQEINDEFAAFKIWQPVDSPSICACSEQFREIILELRSISQTRRITSDLTGIFSDRVYLADRRLSTLARNSMQSPEMHSPDCAALGPSCFIAALIYLYSSLRDFPIAVPIFDKFLERLMPLLLANDDLMGSWNGKHQLLLWVLATSASAAYLRQWRFELVVHLANVCAKNKVDSFEKFVEQLKAVVWRDAEKDSKLMALWSEVELVRILETMPLEQVQL